MIHFVPIEGSDPKRTKYIPIHRVLCIYEAESCPHVEWINEEGDKILSLLQYPHNVRNQDLWEVLICE